MDRGGRATIAILVDAENMAADAAARIVTEMEAAGRVVARRAFADFAGGRGTAWLNAAWSLGFDLVQVPSAGRTKNATDIRLAIDAIELFRRDGVDHVCLVSSDGDFAPLASYLRGAGVRVTAYGKADVSDAFRAACDRFVAVSPPAAVAPVKTATVVALPLIAKAALAQDGRLTKEQRQAVDLVRRAAASLQPDQDGWLHPGLLGAALSRDHPGYSLAPYGGALGKALRAMPGIEVRIDEKRGMVFRLRGSVEERKNA
ncbi:NYN domain-containing protein [Ensifer soli]|uniref:NYN domain-containing protein n=1 Tax=Ciceribacter sp. sgz301302 TaxID=3342379 RepID=UPI0035BAA4CF